jgi:hypothetical protein
MMGHCYTVVVMWISDDGPLLHSGGDVDSRFSFFLNNTFLLRTFEKQVDVLEHKKAA